MSVHHRIGLSDSTTFSCPFCIGGTVTAGFDIAGDGVVLHTVPFCERFAVGNEEPATFLRDAREKIKATDKRLS